MGVSLALCLEALVPKWASGAIVYIGGDDSDAITAGTNFGYEGDVLLQMDDGDNSLHFGTGAAVSRKTNILHHGGTGADIIEFKGKVGEGSTAEVHNFNPVQDLLILGSLTSTAQVTMNTTANGIHVTSAGEVDLHIVGPTSTVGYDLSVDGNGDVVIA